MTYPDEDYGNSGIPWFPVICLGALMVLMAALLATCSSDATDRAQAQSAAQIAAERERTERAIAEQQTTRQAAELRAEQTARITDYSALILAIAAGAIVIVFAGGAVLFGVNWMDNQQTRRTMLLIEAQRQQQVYLPPANRELEPLRLTRRRERTG